MSELGFLFFHDEVDPVEKAQKTAKAVEAVRNELTDRGIIAFVMNADSLPEAEQRLAMREVNSTIDDVVARHMPEDEGAKARLVSSIFKQFEASKQVEAGDKMPMKDGRPAFVSEEEAEEDGKDSDSDEDDEDSDDDDEDNDEDEDDDKKRKSEDDEDEDEDEDSDGEEDDDSSKKEGSVHISEGTIDPRIMPQLSAHDKCVNCGKLIPGELSSLCRACQEEDNR